jgi:indolepyruvate ferredoxin oxidoreductase
VPFLGDSIYTNPIMLGFAWQKGWIPLQLRLAGARHRTQWRGGGQQLAAFAWGRQCSAGSWPQFSGC